MSHSSRITIVTLAGLAGCFLNSWTGADVGDRFGFAVTGAGNIDWDAYDDFAVSAPYADGAGTNRGKVYVYKGNATLGTVAPTSADAAVLVGATDHERAGWSIAAGNFDGDSYTDFAVGAPYKVDASAQTTGAVYLIHGERVLDAFGSTFDLSDSDCIIYGTTNNDTFGWSLVAGDLDGNGTDDLVVGAPGKAGNVGMAYVFDTIDWTDCPTTSDAATVRDTAVAALGYSLAIAENWDGSGQNGLVIGAPLRNGSRGRAYLYGWAGSFGAADKVWAGVTAGDRLGASVAAGDVNGDSAVDVLLGAPRADDGANLDAGKVYVVAPATHPSGSVGSGAVSTHVFIGAAAGDQLGFTVAQGDLSSATAGTGAWAGAPYSDMGASNGGAVFGADATSIGGYPFPGVVVAYGSASSEVDGRSGWALADVGDVTASTEHAGVIGTPYGSGPGSIVVGGP